MGILKGFRGKVVYNDGSYDNIEFKGQNALKAWINGLDLTQARTVTVAPVWSAQGVTVSVQVTHHD